MKRCFDIIFSMIALLVFGIPIIIISLLLSSYEKHPVVFKQKRIGLDKKPFVIFKFQTMVNEVPTTIGRILRKTGLDEILQFVNVLKGDMSIVGPRALTEFDINRLQWNSELYSPRWKVKPGITGFDQIYGGQNKDVSWYWDKRYLDSSNIFMDFVIIIVSFIMNFLGKRRVRNIIWFNRGLR